MDDTGEAPMDVLAEERPTSDGRKFTKVYDRGWDTLAQLATNPMALRVFTFIAKHCDHMNALVCPLEVMAEELDLSIRTIQRANKYLEEKGHLVVLKVGTANAYVLDPTDVWKNYDEYKSYCAFNARTLVSKRQNENMKRRLTHFLGGSTED